VDDARFLSLSENADGQQRPKGIREDRKDVVLHSSSVDDLDYDLSPKPLCDSFQERAERADGSAALAKHATAIFLLDMEKKDVHSLGLDAVNLDGIRFLNQRVDQELTQAE
jgi:hypothetical protein